MPSDASLSAPELKPVRNCDGCTLCCKVLSIEALAKPAGVWCKHCKVGGGCGYYEQRPAACRVFHCDYLLQPFFTPEWKPAKSRLVIASDGVQNRVTVHVDPARPDAWRRAPYYGALKDWSQRALATQGQIVVMIGKRAIVIFPNRDVDLGVMGDDELIVTGQRQSPDGVYFEAYVVRREDPAGESGPVAFDPAAAEVVRMGRTV